MDHKFKYIKSVSDVKRLIAYTQQTGYCSFDLETNGRPHYESDSFITIMGISFQPGSAYVIPLWHSESKLKDKALKILNLLRKGIFENTEVIKVSFNAQFEYQWLKRYNIGILGRYYDAMLAKYLLHEERPNDLGSVSEMIFPEFAGFKDETEVLAKKHGWANIPLDKLSFRNALDCDLTLRLMLYFEPRLIKYNLYSLFRNLLSPLVKTLGDSSYYGIDINLVYLKDLDTKYRSILKDLQEKMYSLPRFKRYNQKRIKYAKRALIDECRSEIEQLKKETLKTGKNNARSIQNREAKISSYMAGNFTTKKDLKAIGEFNPQSDKQMRDFFFFSEYGLQLPILKKVMNKKTKKESDNPSIDEDTLTLLNRKDKSGFISTLLEFNKKSHLYNTYVKGILERVSTNKKVHTSMLIHGTVTGRLSSIKPNLQNIPRGCIHYDTKIITNKGEIIVGEYVPDRVGTFLNGEPLEALTHTGEYKPITHWVNKGLQEMVEISFDNGKTLKCTLDHKLLTVNHGWQKVKNIIAKDYECRSFEA